jgi:hypothetical protein
MISSSAAIMSSLSAFSASGRFSVTVATPSLWSVNTVSFMRVRIPFSR